MSAQAGPAFYGLAAEFGEANAVLHAAEMLRRHGFTVLDAATPVPVEGLGDALGLAHPRLGRLAWAGWAGGFILCFGMITYATIYGYRFDIGGRPLFSWPAYVVPSFAVANACAAIVVFAGMLFLDRLPRLNHPVFNIDGIDRAAVDRYFIIVEERDQPLDIDRLKSVLRTLEEPPLRVQLVPR